MAISFDSSAFYSSELASYSNYSQEQCLTLDDPSSQVVCESMRLNVTDPPSVYAFNNYTSTWSGVVCLLFNTTLTNRVYLPDTFNYCTVPLRGYDAFLFASLALLATCLLFGKLSTVYILISGALLGILNYYVNLLEIGNAVTLWLRIQPADLFFYAFLPPLIVEQAIRIDIYMFRKTMFHSLMLAVVMVIMTAIILTSLILFVLGYEGSLGWSWVYGALFASIIAPTDALAVSSILKKVHGPAVLTAIMEGESLLNDATGITLFEVFQRIIDDASTTNSPSVWSVVPTIIVDIIKLSSIGFGIGLGFSMISYYIMRWIRWRGAGAHIEATYVLAMAYLSYYVTNAVAGGSGVISVVIFGLFGNMTMLWGMTGSSYKSGAFEAVWDMISFAANGLVFFWAGVASLNFLIGSITQIPKDALTYASIILVYIFMLLIRTGCVALFNPLFHLVGEPLTVAEIAFTGWSGLRGAVSLIMLASISSSSYSSSTGEKAVISDIALWTASFVVLTLIINSPLIAPLLKSLKLNETSREAKMIQNKAKMTFFEHTRLCIQRYKDNDDVFLAGADWEIVAKYVDLSKNLEAFGECFEDVKATNQGNIAAWDDNSYSGVAKAFISTLWHGAKQIIVEIATLRIFWKRKDNSDNFSHISSEDRDGIKDFTDSDEDAEDFGNNNECHYQGPSLGMNHSHELEEGKNHEDPVMDIENGIQRVVVSKHDPTGSPDESDQHCLTSKSGKKVFQDLQNLLVEGDTRMEESIEEEEFGREELNRNYTSMPAASRHEMQERIRENLNRQASLGVRQSDKRSTSAEKNSQPARFQDVAAYLSKLSMSKMEDYEDATDRRFVRNHTTLNTTTGKRLHAELMQQQNSRPPSLTRKLDLMGNRADFDSLLQSDTMNSRGGKIGVISHHLRLNSHIDQLKDEFIWSDQQDICTEDESRNVSSFKEKDDNAVTSHHSDSTLNNSALKEIRHRLIGGLKRRFKQRRIGGKLSIGAYLTLEQVCNEKLEGPQDRLDLWELLMKKAREGIIVQIMAYLSYKGTKSFKRANSWAKHILYYPYSLMSKIFRHYLGKTMLVACEVAIEYHLALSTSEHVKWLKLHDENFWTLLQEVEQEIKKSHDFIIDREVEAPDTFRAIQSYRAAVVVLKSMQRFVEDLVDAGVMEENEGDVIYSHVDDKLRKLELTGPVWRPPKFKDIFCTLRPFSYLEPETTKVLWQMGLVQEYKPGQLICAISEQSERLGVFHLLSGVVKSVRTQDHGDREEYYGHGSCFGLLGALHFAPLSGSESIVAVGNALGRGPIVLRFLQSDIDHIQSLAESGSSDMLELLDGWTRLAALYILENSEDSLVDQISSYIDFRSDDEMRISFKHCDRDISRSPFKVQGQSIQEEEPGRNENIERKPSLAHVLSTETIGYHAQELERVSRKTFIQNRATIVAKEITARIRKLLHMSRVVKGTFGDTISQTSSIILLSGQLRRLDRSTQLSGETELNAPAVIPFLDEYEELMQLEHSPNQQGEISWRVVSGTATLLQILMAKKFRPRRANTWKHPTPLFPRGLLAVATPEPAEQYSKAAKKNFRRRQNKNKRPSAEEDSEVVIPCTGKGGVSPQEYHPTGGNAATVPAITNDNLCNVSLSSKSTDTPIKAFSDAENAGDGCSTRENEQCPIDSSSAEGKSPCESVTHVAVSTHASEEIRALSNSKIARKNRRRRRNKLVKRQEKEEALNNGLGPQQEETTRGIQGLSKITLHDDCSQTTQADQQYQQSPLDGFMLPLANISVAPQEKQVTAMYEEQKEDGTRVRFIDHTCILTPLEKIASVLRVIDLDSLTKDEGPHPSTEEDKDNVWVLLEGLESMESQFIVRKCVRVCESWPHPIVCYQVKCSGGPKSYAGSFFSFFYDGTPWRFTEEIGEYFYSNRLNFKNQQEEEEFTMKERQRLVNAGMEVGPDKNPLSKDLSSLGEQGFVYRGRPRELTKHTIFYQSSNHKTSNLSPEYKTKMLAYKVYYKVKSSGSIKEEYHLGGEHLFYPSGRRCALPININRARTNAIIDCIRI